MKLVYRIKVMESERGWGQKYWNQDYDTYEEAKAAIQRINADNTAPTAPDWYMQAEDKVTVVEIQDYETRI